MFPKKVLLSTYCFSLNHSTVAVSYTHLDVYKRQVYGSDHSTVVKAKAISGKK